MTTKFHTDEITNILCCFQEGEIDEDLAINRLARQPKKELAETIIDYLQRQITWEVIAKIPKEDFAED